ncbi:MAG: hypothetical protein ACI4BB_05190 [Coprococcus sp.]
MRKRVKELFLRIMVFFVLSVLWSVMVTQSAMADEKAERFTITCDAGDGFYIADSVHHYPVQVSVSNNGGDFNGVIKLMMYTGSSMEEVLAYVQAAVIPSGETEIFKFNVQNIYFDQTPYAIPVRIELLDENGNQLCCQILDFQVSSDGGEMLLGGVVSRNDQICQLISASAFDYEAEYSYGRVTMQGIELTSDDILSMDLSRLDILVLDMDVSDEAWEKILDWLMTGEHLIINRKLYDVRIQKILDNDNTATWGNGRILVYDENDQWTGTEVIRYVKTLFGTSGMNEILNGSNDSYWIISNQLSYDMWSRMPGIGGYLIVLLAYILLMGPAAYILLSGKKDRREYLWGVIPCLAIVFSLLIYWLGGSTRYADTFIRYGSTVHLTEEGSVENTRMMVTSPDKGHTMVTLEEGCDLQPVLEDYYWNGDQNFENCKEKLLTEEYDLAVTASEERTELLIDSKSVFDKSYFSVSRVFENEGRLDAELQFFRGCFSGTITNSTSWNLENVFIDFQGVGLMIGTVPAGQSVSLDHAEADTLLLYSDSLNLDLSVYGEEENQTAAGWIMRNLIDNSNLLLDKDSALIAGFTEDYDIGIEEGSQIESVNGMALIIQDIPIISSGEGWSSQAVVWGTGASDEDKENYDSYNYMIYSTDPINFDYQLDGTFRPDYVRWVNYDPYVHIEFYNYETGDYDSVFGASHAISGEKLVPYLDDHYLIKAKVWADDEYSRYIPVFTVTGGGADD